MCFKKFLLLIMWFLCQLQELYLVCDTATIGNDLTESETRRTSFVGCPLVLRSDLGTENSMLAYFQPFLRHDCSDRLAGTKSF